MKLWPVCTSGPMVLYMRIVGFILRTGNDSIGLRWRWQTPGCVCAGIADRRITSRVAKGSRERWVIRPAASSQIQTHSSMEEHRSYKVKVLGSSPSGPAGLRRHRRINCASSRPDPRPNGQVWRPRAEMRCTSSLPAIERKAE